LVSQATRFQLGAPKGKQRRPIATEDFWPNNTARHLFLCNSIACCRYSFTGRFTGSFKNLKSDGRKISFRAVDIYRVQNGQISDNWHLEDNLSLMQQLGFVTP